jgi:magnesium-transporting ATPase (P-type)
LNTNLGEKWPYLPDLETPAWTPTTQNWLQMFLLYITLLSNFVPLSLYVTVEMCNFFLLYLVYTDLEMYDDKTDTRALARSTNVTDLGQIQYIFSDKTGTLTQNVMRFKRCSVDGMIFGTPIEKARPGAETEDSPSSPFHPVRRLLVGQAPPKSTEEEDDDFFPSEEKLTFNAEMFLRVMCLCHTVVVEKDLDLSDGIDATQSVASQTSSASRAKKYAKKFFSGGKQRARTVSEMSANSAGYGLEKVEEDVETTDFEENRARALSAGSFPMMTGVDKGKDGAPNGFAYQAESPDEGALVSAASKSFGFQVVGRDSSGIKVKSSFPTIFTDGKVVQGIKDGSLSPLKLAADSASNLAPMKGGNNTSIDERINDPSSQRTETWSILAVNKFDSDRKRMSIVLRAPPELGGFVMVLCKGADSAMLDPKVCIGAENMISDGAEGTEVGTIGEDEPVNQEAEWMLGQMLGLQTHLGEFASEGLRTLVLGMRFLSEKESEAWLEVYKTAATSIKNRGEMLTDAAYQIEQKLHIVGATAIEDKLQDKVGETIAQLEKAGIKLWVLTGDKRETAIEIGYSSHVLTPRMHVTEVADRGAKFVRAQCAMEFMRLVKSGQLTKYQRSAVDQSDDSWSMGKLYFTLEKLMRSLWRGIRRRIINFRIFINKILGVNSIGAAQALKDLGQEEEKENEILQDVVRRRNVRNRAEELVQDFLDSPEGRLYRRKEGQDPSSNSDDDVPSVFQHARSARALLDKQRSEGRLTVQDVRSLSMTQLTVHEMEQDDDQHLFDEDTLSMHSFFPITGDSTSDFDKRRRTILEKLFAVDRDVRKGRLVKHLKKEKRQEALASPQTANAVAPTGDGPRALVIEGAALKYLLGDAELEELIFAIASNCEAVIACRVSPRQKALLVQLVRRNISPEPVTLAIGDGANDVGMIQEAHVGIGISGKEGKQAVNASDFAIAQFRFLETLILIHGRWDFFRASTVVMYSFYKNALMAGCLILFNGETVYSGQPLFDQWVLSSLNFVAGWPIVCYGMFDRCLEKDYVRRNPEVYQASRENELITNRVRLRWILLIFVHVSVLYYGSVNQLTNGGGVTSAFMGLMKHKDLEFPGDGEGGDLQSVGTVTYTALIFLLAYKVLFESRSIINGEIMPFTCRSGVGEGFSSRLGYTWIAFAFGSIGFYYFFLFMYDVSDILFYCL